jgi:hypothetical protein
MSLQASLPDFTVSEVIYLLSHFGKTGALTFRSGKASGEVYFDKGSAVHALYGNQNGSEAVYSLCLETSGDMKFTAGTRSPEVTIKEGADKLIEEGERRRVEMAEILKTLPPMDTVLVRTAQAPEETAVTIRRSDWTILALVNGKRDIRTIVDDSKLGILEVAKTLSWLLSKNLVVDPLEVQRILREKMHFCSLLLEEFGAKGGGAGPWVEFVKATLAALDKGGHMSRQVEFGESAISPAPGGKADVSREEAVEVWDKLAEAMHQRAVKEFGPMLAKHKYQAAMSRV